MKIVNWRKAKEWEIMVLRAGEPRGGRNFVNFGGANNEFADKSAMEERKLKAFD